MKLYSRIISLLVAGAVILSVVGCKDGSVTSDVSQDTTTAATVSEPAVQESTYEAQYQLSNPNATDAAKRVYDYINSVYKTQIISGQQESTWRSGGAAHEMNYIMEKTGKLPAIRGLDYMSMDFDGCNQRAIEWWNDGGIVTICWHCGADFTGEWNQCMNTQIMDWDAALTEGTPEYEMLIAGMDMGAQALLQLQEAGVPVLWRPFHELDGGWFWWSKGGAENFKKLWIMMYDRYTHHWGLNNLIWVLGYSGEIGRTGSEWYPGDEYCDIVGADSYNKGPNQVLYRCVGLVVEDRKPICFHECGTIPTPEQLIEREAKWCYFMTWHTDYITAENDPVTLKEIYEHEYVITLDELPDLKGAA